ncbi:MAG: phosphotransferase [Syntrophaceae bacterium]
MILPESEIAGAVRKVLGLNPGDSLEIIALSRRGSERNFYRALVNSKTGGKSVIVVNYSPGREENNYYTGLARFLKTIGVAVPEIIADEEKLHVTIMQDLGNTDLWSFRNAAWEHRRGLYRKSLDMICRLHSFPAERARTKMVKMMPGFGPEHYRWEREYFRGNFLQEFCGLAARAAQSAELENELAALAGRLCDSRSCLVHRDFQSQNIMVSNSEVYLIDFQGMRTGSPFYDLGSLLYDPYVRLAGEERLELLEYYFLISGSDLEWNAFEKCFREAAAQRLMQSLGAYGFLGLKKGLSPFLEHIPSALDNLIDAAGKSGSLPRLLATAGLCREKINS